MTLAAELHSGSGQASLPSGGIDNGKSDVRRSVPARGGAIAPLAGVDGVFSPCFGRLLV